MTYETKSRGEEKPKPIRTTFYSKIQIPVFLGKRYRHTSDLLVGLAVRGPCTTRTAAKYVLENTPDYEYKPVRDRESSNLAKNYNNLINDKRSSKKHWSGLLTQKYVVRLDEKTNEKNTKAYAYALTMKGCFVALGYDFTDDQLTSFIKNASRNNLYFAYINRILSQTSISFVKDIFISSIQRIIKKGRITLDDEIGFYFNNIADINGYALIELLSDVIEKVVTDSQSKNKRFDLMSHPRMGEIEILKKNTFYAFMNFDDWIDRMTNYFYPNEDEREFRRDYSKGSGDARLLYYVMRAIHHSYFNAFSMGTPKLTSRLPPNSREWKSHYKDKKHSLMMRKKLIAG